MTYKILELRSKTFQNQKKWHKKDPAHQLRRHKVLFAL